METKFTGPVRPNPGGDIPRIDETAHIDPTALIIGKVIVGPGVYVGPYAVIRADEVGDDGEIKPIEIGAQSNIQDGVIIHALGGTCVTIGKNTSLAHGSVIHGPCRIGPRCFVGFKAVVYNSILGQGVFVNTGAVVQEVEIGDDSFVPACTPVVTAEDVRRIVREISESERLLMNRINRINVALADGYNRIAELQMKIEQ